MNKINIDNIMYTDEIILLENKSIRKIKVSGKCQIDIINSKTKIVEKNKLKGIIDVNGKVIVDCIYSDIDRKSMNNKYAILKTTDSKYVLYDITNRKEIIKSDSYPGLSYQYFSINKDGVNQYYTYNGKLIYESK